MPQDGMAADIHHRFGAIFSFFAQTRPEAAAKHNYFQDDAFL
jgi:hypothetical protein